MSNTFCSLQTTLLFLGNNCIPWIIPNNDWRFCVFLDNFLFNNCFRLWPYFRSYIRLIGFSNCLDLKWFCYFGLNLSLCTFRGLYVRPSFIVIWTIFRIKIFLCKVSINWFIQLYLVSLRFNWSIWLHSIQTLVSLHSIWFL